MSADRRSDDGCRDAHPSFGQIPELDSQGRPKEFYSRRVHDTCYRRPVLRRGTFCRVLGTTTRREKAIAFTRWAAKARPHTTPVQSRSGTRVSDIRSRRDTAASDAAKKLSGTKARSTNGCLTSRDSVSSPPPTRRYSGNRRDSGRSRFACDRLGDPKAKRGSRQHGRIRQLTARAA
jgi:hypothetical protein